MIWASIKKWLKVIVYGLGGLVALITGLCVWKRYRSVILGRVTPDTKVHWMPVDEDPTSIFIHIPNTTEVQKITLPEGYTSTDVRAVGYEVEKQITVVEVKHEKVDRRSGTTIADSAADVFKSRNVP